MRISKKKVERWKIGRLGEIQLELTKFKMEEKQRKTYKQEWSAYNLAQTNEFRMFQDMLIELIDSTIDLKQKYKKNGRPFYNLKDMIFCCVMKVYFGKSSRRNVGYLQIAKGNDYIKKVPHFNTLLNYYRNPLLTSLLKHLVEQSAIPLRDAEMDFATDSSGFSTCIFSRWFNARIGKDSERRMFRKCHICSGVKTNIITAINISEGYSHDSPYFKGLINTTSRNFQVREVSADAGYLSRDNYNAVHEIGAIPYIMFRSNCSIRAKGSLIYKRMFELFEKHNKIFLEHYHKRSNVESVFHMIKRKFGLFLFSKSDIGQTNEILCKCLAHNICVLIQEIFETNVIFDSDSMTRKIVRGYYAD